MIIHQRNTYIDNITDCSVVFVITWYNVPFNGLGNPYYIIITPCPPEPLVRVMPVDAKTIPYRPSFCSPISHHNFIKCGPIITKRYMAVAGYDTAIIGQCHRICEKKHIIFYHSGTTHRRNLKSVPKYCLTS